MTNNLERCLTRADLSRLLGVSTRTVRRMDRDGTGPRPIRPSPRTVRYAAAEVAEFVRAAGLSAPAEIIATHDRTLFPGAR